MRIPIVQIGNSKGVRISAAILKQCKIGQEVELKIKGRDIILRPTSTTRCKRFDNIKFQ